MRKSSSIVAGALLMVACAALYAAAPKPYASLGVGYVGPADMPEGASFEDLAGVIPLGTSSSTNDNFGGRIAVGVLWNEKAPVSVGLETAAAYYGATKYANDVASVEMNYYGVELLGVAQWNLGNLRLIGKAGATDERLHPTKSNIDNSGLTDGQQVLPEIGLGIAYSFTSHFQLGLSYYHTFGQTVGFDSNAEAENLPSVNMSLLEFKYLL